MNRDITLTSVLAGTFKAANERHMHSTKSTKYHYREIEDGKRRDLLSGNQTFSVFNLAIIMLCALCTVAAHIYCLSMVLPFQI